ncbi:hypothetical protein [Oceanobacillus halophilus]|uniref:Uncharacterized protein n=1 Tax=Oceanobacillus halophilus TaxID=930130 RepID=A0A495AE82_9BACI|nr:hypothetical protein [Oceanobacillus halophilus]RKQ37764.1 hypothetical protein D8M06_02890 [Oceanobacillus halophilus]
MAKQFTAYFKSEDDLLSAHASLRTLRTSNVTIDSVPRQNTEEGFVPFVALNNTTSNMGYATVYREGDEQNELYMLEGLVDETQFDKAMNIIQRNDGIQK